MGVFILVVIFVLVKVVGMIMLLCVDEDIEIIGLDLIVYGECVYDVSL